ncbi:hypothetical protein, partial [Staphylococcus xylosus]|uniref:hypothetical protein n=1 Tax=Staphylococcus xylosus TaxID=1288 RepID=UPI00210D1071
SLIIQYCCSVVSLEYRNQVFPYEYMAFSRRVGELWECFCKTAWDYPVNDSVCRIQPPNFINVKSIIIDRIRSNLGNNPSSNDVMSDVNKLCDVIGNINMKEDEVFRKDDIPHVIDFKSGFGSNEKGNMLRLLAVGKAYKIWDSRTQLMLLIRQNDNNHYLNSLRNSRIWDVHTGLDSYKKIKEITGSDIENVLKIINWESDFSNNFYEFLVRYNLTKYLDW